MKPIVETNKVAIYEDKILIKKKKIVLKKEDIKEIFYAKWSLKNFILIPSNTIQGRLAPGFIFVFLNNPYFLRKSYCFRMKYEDAKKIPSKLCRHITIKE